MTLYLLRRVLQSIVVLLLVTVITFALLRAIPGNPAVAVLGPNSFRNPAALRQFDRQYGFDLPWYSQYWLWLRHLLTGNLGFSWRFNQSVASLLGNYLPKTIVLVGISTVLALLIAVPVGMIQAVRRNKFVDHFFNGFSTVLYAMPDFLIGILLIMAFAIQIPLFPPEGPQGEKPRRGVRQLQRAHPAHHRTDPGHPGAVQPVHALGRAGQPDRGLRPDGQGQGAGERRVLIRHVLRNSMIPIATLLGLSLPGIFGGALITEAVFNYPGIGYLFDESAQSSDYPTLLGITVVVAAATVVGSLLADILYAVLDPRVRYVNQ